MLYFVLKQEETDPKIKETLMAEYQKQKVNLISLSLSALMIKENYRFYWLRLKLNTRKTV